MHACIGEEMGDERCQMGLENLVEQNLEENQCSMSSNSGENNNNNNNNANINTNNNDKKQEFLPKFTPNIIHHFSTNNHEQVDQFLQISTTTTTTTSSATTTNNNNTSSHFLSSATPIPPPAAAAVANNTTNQNFYAKGCNKNNMSSNTSTSTNTGNNNNNNNSNKEQDRFLPIANVGRIMKKFIPGNGKISKDAKETVQECVSEFISFVTGEASDKCQREKRKTINGDDIIWAITTLGFEDYVAPLKHYLNKYRELEGEKLNVPKQQQRNHNDHHHHHQKPNIPNYHCHNNVYSSSTSLPSFVPNDQSFPLPFPQTSNIQTRLPQHEHIDSVGNW